MTIYELTSVTQAANTTESYTYDPVGIPGRRRGGGEKKKRRKKKRGGGRRGEVGA